MNVSVNVKCPYCEEWNAIDGLEFTYDCETKQRIRHCCTFEYDEEPDTGCGKPFVVFLKASVKVQARAIEGIAVKKRKARK